MKLSEIINKVIDRKHIDIIQKDEDYKTAKNWV